MEADKEVKEETDMKETEGAGEKEMEKVNKKDVEGTKKEPEAEGINEQDKAGGKEREAAVIKITETQNDTAVKKESNTAAEMELVDLHDEGKGKTGTAGQRWSSRLVEQAGSLSASFRGNKRWQTLKKRFQGPKKQGKISSATRYLSDVIPAFKRQFTFHQGPVTDPGAAVVSTDDLVQQTDQLIQVLEKQNREHDLLYREAVLCVMMKALDQEKKWAKEKQNQEPVSAKVPVGWSRPTWNPELELQVISSQIYREKADLLQQIEQLKKMLEQHKREKKQSIEKSSPVQQLDQDQPRVTEEPPRV